MGRAKSGKPDLETTREALASWRRQYGGPGRRIPEGFWKQARQLASVHGVAQTARVLRLEPGRLAAEVGQALVVAPTTLEPEAFVEVGGLQFGDQGSVAVVELLGRDGECVRVRVAAAALDIVALASALWGRQP